MNKNFRKSLEKELENPEFKKEWDDLDIGSKLDYANHFAKNHDERLTHDEVFNNVRSRISKV